MDSILSIFGQFANTKVVRRQYALTANIYVKRAAAVAKIPNFWPLVLEQAPPEIDQYIQPQDSRIFAESLLSVDVRRPGLDADPNGNPRSLKFTFEFKPNEDFEDTVLTKEFWYRRAKDGEPGLISEPVKIHWKPGKDLTEGLTDAAAVLFEARKTAENMQATDLPEYDTLKKKVESWNGMNTSFFTWFGWVSSRRWISLEESQAANEEHEARKARAKALEALQPEEVAEPEDVFDDEAVEVHEAGEELALSLADDLWPNAIKFFTLAQEIEELSDADFEEMDAEDDDDDDEPIDIRSLVQDKRPQDGGGQPPAKKMKK